jgi:hypothetical protein
VNHLLSGMSVAWTLSIGHAHPYCDQVCVGFGHEGSAVGLACRLFLLPATCFLSFAGSGGGKSRAAVSPTVRLTPRLDGKGCVPPRDRILIVTAMSKPDVAILVCCVQVQFVASTAGRLRMYMCVFDTVVVCECRGMLPAILCWQYRGMGSTATNRNIPISCTLVRSANLLQPGTKVGLHASDLCQHTSRRCKRCISTCWKCTGSFSNCQSYHSFDALPLAAGTLRGAPQRRWTHISLLHMCPAFAISRLCSTSGVRLLFCCVAQTAALLAGPRTGVPWCTDTSAIVYRQLRIGICMCVAMGKAQPLLRLSECNAGKCYQVPAAQQTQGARAEHQPTPPVLDLASCPACVLLWVLKLEGTNCRLSALWGGPGQSHALPAGLLMWLTDLCD